MDLGVGGHVGLQFAAGVVDRHPHLESRNVVFSTPIGAIFVTFP